MYEIEEKAISTPLITSSWISISPLLGHLDTASIRYSSKCQTKKAGEQANPSLRMMCAHLGIESRAALSYYITLMEIADILYKDLPETIVMQGKKQVKKKHGNRSNTYYILDVKPVTPERIKQIKTAVQTNETFTESYRQLFLKNLEDWRPIQALWTRPRKRIKTVVGQTEMPLPMPEDEEETAPPSMQEANEKTLEILRQLEITKPSILQKLGHTEPAKVLALIFFGLSKDWMKSNRLSGYVIKNLKPDGAPAPKTYLELAKFWLEADQEQREEIEASYTLSTAYSLTQIVPISEKAAKVAMKLSSRNDEENAFIEWLDI